jgi:hypothetical protein
MLVPWELWEPREPGESGETEDGLAWGVAWSGCSPVIALIKAISDVIKHTLHTAHFPNC